MASDPMDIEKTPCAENVLVPKRSRKMLLDFGEDDGLEDISVDSTTLNESLKKSSSEVKVKKEPGAASEAKVGFSEDSEFASRSPYCFAFPFLSKLLAIIEKNSAISYTSLMHGCH